MPKTDLRYHGFSAVRGNQDFGPFWGFFENFEFFQTENRCVSIDREAPISSVGAPWIVSKTLVVIGRVGRD